MQKYATAISEVAGTWSACIYPGKVIIENNVFESSGSAILIAGDANAWYESGAVRDVLIRNNDFRYPCNSSIYQFCEAVISIDPEIPTSEQKYPYHRNIRIMDNTFHLFDYPILRTVGRRTHLLLQYTHT